jgi:hypothetical protein
MITTSLILSVFALGIVVWATFFKKSNSTKKIEDLEKTVADLKDKSAVVIEGDGEISDAIIMHKGKVIYTKLKNKE